MCVLIKWSKASVIVLVLALYGCQPGSIVSLLPKAEKPIPPELIMQMNEKGMAASSPILVRVFKTENVAEVWKQTNRGKYALLAEYEICRWSGKLGPKFKEGDRQAPEGYYTVRPWQMNPNSDYHLAFNLGFPNAYDSAHGRTGSHLMMHGACSSAGCYSMTDELIEEIFALARESFEGGQRKFQVHAYPFRMTAENMAAHRDHQHFEFWKMLKEGYDHFEITNVPPKVDVCDKRYVFNQAPEDENEKFVPTEACPVMKMPDRLALAYSEKLSEDEAIFEQVLKKEAVKAAWRGEDPEEILADDTSLAVDPEAVQAELIYIDGEKIEKTGVPAIPTPAPRPEIAEAEEPRGLGKLFSWLKRGG